jgi:hypothetical protein
MPVTALVEPDPRWLRHAHIMVAVRAIGGVHRSLLVAHQQFVLNGSCLQSVVNAREPHRQDPPDVLDTFSLKRFHEDFSASQVLRLSLGRCCRQAISAFVIS